MTTWDCDEQTARACVALLAGFHDLGKAGPVFQGRLEDIRAELGGAGLPFPAGALAVGANRRWPQGTVI